MSLQVSHLETDCPYDTDGPTFTALSLPACLPYILFRDMPLTKFSTDRWTFPSL